MPRLTKDDSGKTIDPQRREEETVRIQSPIQLNIPKPSDWECSLFNRSFRGMVWTPDVECVPSWFVRKTSEIFFGCKWRKNVKK